MYKIFFAICFILTCTIAQGQQPGPYNSNIKLNYMRTWKPSMPLKDPAIVVDPARPVEEVKQQTEYMDGMGRLLQTVKKGISPLVNGSGKFDIVTPVLYENVGLEEYKYLPYVAPSGDGSFKLDPWTEQAAFMADQYPNEQAFYERTVYEKSPAHRKLTLMPPGDSWAGKSRGTVNNYLVNTALDAVRIWTIANTADALPVSAEAYTESKLLKNIVTDEHGRKTIEFKNLKDQTVLRKTELTSKADGHAGWLCTYYVYDDFGQLRFVIPPAAVELIADTWSFTNRQQVADGLCYRYFYDDHKRMINRKLPGKAEEELVYDVRDRLVFARDGNLQDAKKWQVTFYDAYNRTVMTALYNSEATRAALQLSMDQAIADGTITNAIAEKGEYDLVLPKREAGITQYQARNSITFTDGFETVVNDEMETLISTTVGNNAVSVTVTNPLPGIAETALTPLTYTYYDNYNWDGDKSYNSGYENELVTGDNLYPEPVAKSNNTMGLTTGSKTRVFLPGGGEQWVTSTFYYDEKGRLIQTLSDNIAGGTDVTASRYNFEGKMLCSFLHHRNPHSGTTPEIKLLTIMEYDYGGHLIAVKKKLNGGSVKTIVQDVYDKAGLLSKKILGPNLQALSYEYNIRGWLIGMNRAYLMSEAQEYRFGYELAYDKSTSVLPSTTYATPQYTGNVAGVIWRGEGDGAKRKYDYTYDQANRLLKAAFLQQSGTTWNNATADFTVTMGNGADPLSAYDANGNIKRMQQRGLKAGVPATLDDLAYKYNPNTNKLRYVRDLNNEENSTRKDFKEPAANNIANLNTDLADYDYDKNGNLKYDLNKKISSIVYNSLNLPEKIVIDGKGSIEFCYDAGGNKLRKIVHDNTKSPQSDLVTDYIGGLTYQNDKLQFIAHEEGRIRPVYKQGSPVTYEYDYFVKDHLSNVRFVLTEQLDFTMYSATMELKNEAVETALFSNVNETRTDKPIGYPEDNKIKENTSVAKLNAKADGRKIGPSIVLKVMTGDTVQINAKAFYKSQEPQNKKNASLVEDMLANLVQTFGGAGSTPGAHNVSGSGLSSPFTTNFYVNDYQRLKERGTDMNRQSRPKAYLNFVLFDEQFKLVEKNSGVRQVKENSDQLQVLSVDKMPIGKNGYLYVFTSNESEQDVYFDDVTVMGTPGPVLEETHYYPFGLTMEGISSNALKGKNYPENKIKYNSKELQQDEFSDGSGLSWYDYGNRMYDMQTGKWNGIDKRSEKTPMGSPYSYVENNPVKFVDPDGNFRIDSRIAQLYPALGYIVEYYLPLVRNNPELLNAISSFTGGKITTDQVSEMFTAGKGPWITPTFPEQAAWDRQSTFNPVFGTDSRYEFYNFQNNLFLKSDYVRQLEKSYKALKTDGSQDNATAFGKDMLITTVALLHELGHYMNYNYKASGNGDQGERNELRKEQGVDFIYSIFGTDFMRDKNQANTSYYGRYDPDAVGSYLDKNFGSPLLFGLAPSPYFNGAYNRLIFFNTPQVVGIQGDPALTKVRF